MLFLLIVLSHCSFPALCYKPRGFLLLLFLGSLASLLYLSITNQSLSPRAPRPHRCRRNVSILLWHWPFGRSYQLMGDRCLETSNISCCYLSDDTSTFATADVVVFHHHELSTGRASLPLHRPRPPSQRWVWLSLEPPAKNANLSRLNGLFNLTMSYRRDADIPIPYGRTERGGRRVELPSNRSCLVGWVVSRYGPDQARSRFYQRLRHHIPIQVYGGWTRRPLSRRQLLPTIARCFFYLSFENSRATDYISEKLWRNALQAGVVPVVLGPGRATYEALAPPGSFIHVDDFGSPAALAAHLRRLAADPPAYGKFFEWQRSHRVETTTDWRQRLCQICLRFPQLPPRKCYHDLQAWVSG